MKKNHTFFATILVFIALVLYFYQRSTVVETNFVYEDKKVQNVFCESVLSKYNGEKIVNIGEAIHGSESISQFEMCIAKYLISHNRFKKVFIEAEYLSTNQIEKFVKGGDVSIKPDSMIEKYEKYSLNNTKSLFSFLQWLRLYNSNLSDAEKFLSTA